MSQNFILNKKTLRLFISRWKSQDLMHTAGDDFVSILVKTTLIMHLTHQGVIRRP